MTPPPDLAQQAAEEIFRHKSKGPVTEAVATKIIAATYAPYFESASARELAERAATAIHAAARLKGGGYRDLMYSDIIEPFIAPRMAAAEEMATALELWVEKAPASVEYQDWEEAIEKGDFALASWAATQKPASKDNADIGPRNVSEDELTNIADEKGAGG